MSIVLLLRRHGRLTARQLADELEVSTRTVLRDVEALSGAGVPVYAERGRHGGFALLPGFRAELGDLHHDEALALLTATSRHGGRVFGLGPALASAMRKVVDALPDGHRARLDDASRRFLVEPETDLLSRRAAVESPPSAVMGEVREAVLAGRKFRFRYAAPDQEPRLHEVDPVGLVTVRDRTYLLATKAGEDRTYRVSRMLDAEMLPEPADRPADVDLDETWARRAARFLADGHVTVVVDVDPSVREDLVRTARAVREETPQPGGRLRLELVFQDLRHAVWAVWQAGTAAEAISPEGLRAGLLARATALADRYRPPPAGARGNAARESDT
ncbi:WYL domain-containing protein [Cellulosimicrobium marinum]|nr:WYL domain-containing protein [Cellulosimicrobium marinum]